MGFWGWRQTAWMTFISVLVVACTDTAPLPSPTRTPTPRPITLTIQGSPGAPPATPRPTMAAVTATPSDVDPAVRISPPVCTDTVNDGRQCIGLVHNVTGDAHGTLLLRAELYHNSMVVDSQMIAVEQRLLGPDASAPYRAIFDGSAEGPLVLSVSELFPPSERLVSLALRDELGRLDGGDYALSAVLVNDRDYAVERVRAIAALYRNAQIVGYRVFEVNRIDAGAEVDIALRWHGVEDDDGYRHSLTVDGYRIP